MLKHPNYYLVSLSAFIFCFDHFLEARVEICKKLRWFFGISEEKKKKNPWDSLTFRQLKQAGQSLPMQVYVVKYDADCHYVNCT